MQKFFKKALDIYFGGKKNEPSELAEGGNFTDGYKGIQPAYNNIERGGNAADN